MFIGWVVTRWSMIDVIGVGGRVEEGGDAKIKVVLFGMLVEETV